MVYESLEPSTFCYPLRANVSIYSGGFQYSEAFAAKTLKSIETMVTLPKIELINT